LIFNCKALKIAIAWQLDGQPILSPKDAIGKSLKEAELFA